MVQTLELAGSLPEGPARGRRLLTAVTAEATQATYPGGLLSNVRAFEGPAILENLGFDNYQSGALSRYLRLKSA